MNIFALSDDPVEAAVWQHDKHVVKMTLESAQLLSAAVRLTVPVLVIANREGILKDLYKVTHQHHPSTKWARECTANYRWLCEHAKALAREYTHRFGRRHKSEDVIDKCIDLLFFMPNDPASEHTPFRVAIKDRKYHVDGDPIASYRLYYLHEKIKEDSKWSEGRRGTLPDWMLSRIS